MLAVNVPGGANSGCKQPKREPSTAWTCTHGHDNKGTWTRCLTVGCNEKRAK